MTRERIARLFSSYRFLRLCFLLPILLFMSGVFGDQLKCEVKQQDSPAPAPDSVNFGTVKMPSQGILQTANTSSATGRVMDGTTDTPLQQATVTLNGTEVVYTDSNGLFPIKSTSNQVGARSLGYTRAEMAVNAESSGRPVDLRLKPIKPKALYLTVCGVSSTIIKGEALKLLDKTDLNALVIDMKGDRGFIPYKSDIPLATTIGAQKLRLVKDIKGVVQSLKANGIYTIARIVVFKDDRIGQKIDRLATAVDYISLMLYPSGFHLGIPNYRNPVANTYKIVYLSMKKAQERTHLSPLRFRPWLQAFRDYAFDRRPFTGVEIRKQIKAA